ncbi:MAG: SipW-dependent-type signal peptide-containing protein, partial [Clostridia bacterium]|nr:SipW-dependent-type signal peptide-containing protein [Clostridia bacterium]
MISSAMALFLCFVMLIGTTFAWFTDTASSTGNVIKTGTLEVELWQHFADGSSVNISETSASIFNHVDADTANGNTANTLWEPGKTQTVYLSIKNNGTLDLKYTVAIEVTDITNNLNEVLTYIITPDAQISDPVAKAKLLENAHILSSANSINWGRLAPQIVYYVSAYCDLLNANEITYGETVNVCVPTGNFGNILAAYIAKNMGLPLNK